jgi:hypothetical protein
LVLNVINNDLHFSDGNGTFFLPQRGLKFVGTFYQGRPAGLGTIFNSDGEIVQPLGPWGSEVDISPLKNSNNFLQNFDLSSNKYTNLIKMVGDWVYNKFG